MENKEEKIVSSSTEDVVNYRGVKAMPFIIGMETLDRIGTFGTSSNLLVYLTTVFNLKNVTSTIIINIFNGTVYISPLFGGFLSDSYLGRYNTIAFASLSSLMGMTIVMLTAAISKLHPLHCVIIRLHPGTCAQPTAWQLAFLATGFFLLVIGSGGFRPCLLPFGADQFDPGTDSGKRGISSFFNWYYFTLSFALIISLTLIIYVQSNVSWAIGYAIPTCLMLVACVLFFWGSKLYVKLKPEGSPLISVAQVILAAIKKRKLKLPSSQNPMCSLFEYLPVNSMKLKLSNTNQFRFLDKSAIITTEDQINSDGTTANPWRLCSIQQVEEVKCIIRVIPVWLSSIIHHLGTVEQQVTFTILQALQSDRNLGSTFQVPAASYGIFTNFSPVIWIPIYDRILVPVLRKYTRKKYGLTLLQRMAIGMVVGILTMLVSGQVEQHRRHLALTRPTLGMSLKGGAISSMSAFWLVPQLMLAGLAEALNSIAQVEFYYEQFPENMRSIGTSIFYCGLAGSSYLNGFLVSIVHRVTSTSSSYHRNWLPEDLNKGRLDYYYYLIACLGCLNFLYFLVCAKWYRYKGGDL